MSFAARKTVIQYKYTVGEGHSNCECPPGGMPAQNNPYPAARHGNNSPL